MGTIFPRQTYQHLVLPFQQDSLCRVESKLPDGQSVELCMFSQHKWSCVERSQDNTTWRSGFLDFYSCPQHLLSLASWERSVRANLLLGWTVSLIQPSNTNISRDSLIKIASLLVFSAVFVFTFVLLWKQEKGFSFYCHLPSPCLLFVYLRDG